MVSKLGCIRTSVELVGTYWYIPFFATETSDQAT